MVFGRDLVTREDVPRANHPAGSLARIIHPLHLLVGNAVSLGFGGGGGSSMCPTSDHLRQDQVTTRAWPNRSGTRTLQGAGGHAAS